MEQAQALRRLDIDARVLSGDPFWINKLRPRGIASYAQTWRSAQRRWSWADCDGVPVVFFPYIAGGIFRPCVHAFTYDLGLRSVLAGIRNDFDYDIVHAHTSYLDGTAGLTAARFNNVPFMITEHTGPFSLLTNHFLKRWMTRRAVCTANHVIAVGDALRSQMATKLDIPDSLITVLPNGYDTRTFHNRERTRRRDSIKALWVGHFVPVKRVDRLIEAFTRMADKFPQLMLSLIGDGEGLESAQRDVARRGLSERCVFLKKADRAGVAEAMRAHDFLVVSSDVETFSLVTIEAFASGLPVLSTRCGGPEGLVTELGLGRIVSNDVDGLTRGLSDMCESIDTFDHDQIAAHARKSFSWEGVARELKLRYGRLIEAS